MYVQYVFTISNRLVTKHNLTMYLLFWLYTCTVYTDKAAGGNAAHRSNNNSDTSLDWKGP